MDQIDFLFQRNPARTPDDFIEHYHDTHAVMGRTWVKGVAGYVVSLADISQEPLAAVRSGTPPITVDSLTQLTVDSMPDFFDTDIAIGDPERVEIMMTDHDSMFSVMHAYQVERRTVVAGEQDWPTLERSPGVKLLTLLSEGDEGLPTADEPGVWRSSENRVLSIVTPGSPPLTAIVERQFREPADLDKFLAEAAPGTVPVGSYILSEFVQLP